ncbi:MAG: Eco57I restriction-modification methylase domain-containing protein [Candidatus Poribacteria bacterium]|nr:Eco57I restriction-modification methylase domain-containing protein [Candidatus Poribacteria bacterium]
MPQTHIRADVQRALSQFTNGELHENAIHLLKVLGYQSQRTLNRDTSTTEAFLEDFDPDNLINPEKALLHEWQTADFLFQLTADEIRQHTQETFTFNEDPGVDESIYQSYLFLAIRLKGDTYSRTALANITREINKLYAIPAMLIFQYGHALTFSIINRRPSQRDAALDVLEKVTLIKDIDVVNPHRAHLDILAELSLDALYQQHGFTNFLELHQAWQRTLDTSELNRRFFKEIADWYFWAVEKVTFPHDKGGQGGSADAGDDVAVRNATCIIRLITRLIFVWFLKEKGLVPSTLFDEDDIAALLADVDPQEGTYYKAILQNLFFATLNQEMNPPNKRGRGVPRKFRGEGRQHYNITSLYRYKRYFKDPEAALHLFETIPFLNGGLFECLDKPAPDDAKTILRIDGFSDREDNPLSVPNELFFSEPQAVNLNAVYDTKNSRYTVRGLIHILNRYKFTIAENTPIEQEIALDPELLGQVFENLLAAYNPETGTTARKQTGSFYTPREVVNYMVDESLIAYLQNTVRSRAIHCPSETKLRHLLTYNDEPHPFTDTETEQLITAIDTLKILDPACGSGAFPMGILHKLVFLLSKLDPRNAQWRQRQIDRVQNTITEAEKIDDSVIRESTIDELEGEIENINEAFERNELDYGRKLYLIENCIYGVDIQPIATQIAKLRFFISLIVEQKIDDTRENRGVRPLPNLETKFVAANTLLGVEKPAQMTFRNPEIDSKEKALEEVRRRHFTARTPRTKDRYRQQDATLRAEISALLQQDGFPSETTEKIAGWDPYDQNAAADFFDPEWMFGITDGFDVVIGNPPYVRQEKIKDLKPTLKKRYACYTGAADLYVYFYERGLQLLNTSGIHTFICSNSWLDVNYGAPLQKYLLDNTTGAVICHSEAEREFESADINTIVSILHNGTPDADSQIRFLTFKTFIGDPDIENRRERTRTYTELAQAGTRENKYTGDKWGGKYLRAPDIYWTLLEKGKDKLVRLGDVAEVRFGIKTGANDFFYLDAERIQEWGIASEFLKPVIKSPRECKSIRVDPSELQFKLFMCHADRAALAGTAALKYIECGESQGYHQRPSCRGRPRWWDLGKWDFADLLWIETMHESFKVHRNAPSIYESDKFYGIKFQGNIDTLTVLLNSTPVMLFKLLSGFHSLGGGGLKTAVYEVKDFHILQPELVAFNEDLVNTLIQREIGTIQEDVEHPNRRALDAIIFDALDLTQGERDGVYEAVVNLVESRLRKARSLKGK